MLSPWFAGGAEEEHLVDIICTCQSHASENAQASPQHNTSIYKTLLSMRSTRLCSCSVNWKDNTASPRSAKMPCSIESRSTLKFTLYHSPWPTYTPCFIIVHDLRKHRVLLVFRPWRNSVLRVCVLMHCVLAECLFPLCLSYFFYSQGLEIEQVVLKTDNRPARTGHCTY